MRLFLKRESWKPCWKMHIRVHTILTAVLAVVANQ